MISETNLNSATRSSTCKNIPRNTLKSKSTRTTRKNIRQSSNKCNRKRSHSSSDLFSTLSIDTSKSKGLKLQLKRVKKSNKNLSKLTEFDEEKSNKIIWDLSDPPNEYEISPPTYEVNTRCRFVPLSFLQISTVL